MMITMHAIAPKTVQSGEAASHPRERHGRHAPSGGKAGPTHELLAAAVEHTTAAPAPKQSPSEIASLDEGDVILHVVGTGLGVNCAEFVRGVATRLRLRGWIRCEAGGMTLRAVGREPELATLVHEILEHAPVDASIRAIDPDTGDGGADLPESGFVIISSDFSLLHEPVGPAPVPGAVPDW